MFANFQDDYLYGVYGENVYSSEYGLYNSTRIDKYAMRVMIPLTYLNNEVCGFIGYAPALLGEETITNKYIYPNSDVLPKAKIMFCPKGVYADAIRDGYVCIVDGIFDAIILNAVGIHAASLCGSSLTKYHKLFLSAIRTKIVVPDNDVAGTKVVQLLENAFDRVRIIFREDSKDVDDFMKIPGNLEKFVKEFYEWKQSDFCGSMYMRSVTRGDTELFNREALRLRRDSEDERQTIGITDIVSGLIDNYNS